MIKKARLLVLAFTLTALPQTTLAEGNPTRSQCSETLSTALLKMYRDHHPQGTQALAPTLVSSIDRFCECKQKTNSELNSGSWIEQSFKNPRDHFDEDDQCALDTLAKSDYQVIFLTQLNLRMMPLIQVRLEERYRTIASSMATMASFNSHLRCLSDKMIYLCAKTYSLATTYQCLHGYLSKARKIDHLERDCPALRTEDGPGPELDLTGPRI